MQASELKGKSSQELKQVLADLLREQFNQRLQLRLGQAGNPSGLKKMRRDIARIKTVLRQNAAPEGVR